MKELIILGFLTVISLISGEFIVPDYVSGDLGDTLKLQCKLEGKYRWYAISWKRIDDDGKEKLIVTLPIDTLQADWNSNNIATYGGRLSPFINVNSLMTEFSLEIKEMKCSDKGKYSCNVIGNFPEKTKEVELAVVTFPGKPSTDYSVVQTERNTTFDLTCRAALGFPETKIVWLFKSEGAEVFSFVTEEAQEEISEISPCEKTAKSTLSVFISEDSDGTIYRCALEGRHTESDYFKDVTIQLEDLITTSSPVTVKNPNCDGTVCISETQDGPSNAAPLINAFSFIVILSSLLLVL